MDLVVAETILLPFSVVFLSVFLDLFSIWRLLLELLIELKKLYLLRVVEEQHRRKNQLLHMANVGLIFHQFNTQKIDLHDIYHNQGIIVEFLIIRLKSMQTFEIFRDHAFQISDRALLK